jgi:hypothetical protein
MVIVTKLLFTALLYHSNIRLAKYFSKEGDCGNNDQIPITKVRKEVISWQ